MEKVLETLSTIMQDIEDTFGEQNCIDYCDQVYSSMYRTDETFSYDPKTDSTEFLDGLVFDTALYLATKAGKYIKPVSRNGYMPCDPEFDDDGEEIDLYELYQDCDEDDGIDYAQQIANGKAIDEFKVQAKQLVLNGAVFVYICNYKGEGEGYRLLQDAQHMQLYVGKYDYR